MAAKNKLTYFPVAALGEPIRFILSYSNIEFEDFRFKWEDWPTVKSTTPYGKCPVLELDGKQLHQSAAICRYLAKKVNLCGKDDMDDAQIDAIVDTFTDYRTPIAMYFYDPDPASKESKREHIQNEHMPFYLDKFDKIVKDNGGYFVGGRLTWADFFFVSMYHYFEHLAGKKYLDSYPNLKALIDKVQEIPQIKGWLARRPADQWFN